MLGFDLSPNASDSANWQDIVRVTNFYIVLYIVILILALALLSSAMA